MTLQRLCGNIPQRLCSNQGKYRAARALLDNHVELDDCDDHDELDDCDDHEEHNEGRGCLPAHTQWRELALIGPWRPPPCSQNVIAPLAKPKEVTLHTPLLGTVLRPRIFKNIV